VKSTRSKYVVGFFPGLKEDHLTKDVCMIPFYIGKHFDLPPVIVGFSDDNKVLANKIKRIKDAEKDRINVLKLSQKIVYRKLAFPFFLIMKSKKIQILYLYQFGFNIPYKLILTSFLYKFFNPKGVLHIKFEADPNHLKGEPSYTVFKTLLLPNYFKNIDVFGVKGVDFTYNTFKKYKSLTKKKIKLQYNGFNALEIKTKVGSVKPFNERYNIITLSGRLDQKVKGLDVFLSAVNLVELSNWKINLYGGNYDAVLRMVKEKINEKSIEKISVFGTVPYEQLYNGLNNSKIYVLSSYADGMPLAVVEAMALGNVIICADHYGMSVALKGGELGRLFRIGDSEKLASILQQTINDNSYLEETFTKSVKYTWDNYSWDSIIKSIYKE